MRILVFAGPDGQATAKGGRRRLWAPNLADQIVKGWTDFDVVLATPDMMRIVGRLGRCSATRPHANAQNRHDHPGQKICRGSSTSRAWAVSGSASTRLPTFTCPSSKASFGNDKLLQNLGALMEAHAANRPLKGQQPSIASR